MPEHYRVKFIPDELEISVTGGTNLLTAAVNAGILINASCGGMGVCRTCKIKIEQGRVSNLKSEGLTVEEYNQGVRLACQCRVESDLTVFIPPESRLDKGNQPVETGNTFKTTLAGGEFQPVLQKIYLEISPPTPDNNASDLFRLLDNLKGQFSQYNFRTDMDVIRKLPVILRESDWKVTVSILADSDDPQGAAEGTFRIINIEPGDRRSGNLAVAIDLGTTTISAQLLDLTGKRVLGQATVFNRQKSYGDDVIARIAYCQKPEGLKRLQTRAVESINEAIERILKDTQSERNDIGHITLAGNTTMQQILLGLDPRYIRLQPYVPVANFLPLVKAVTPGLNVPGHVNLYTFPSVSSYVGGDIVSGVAAMGIRRQKKLTYYLDIGTNGEIVLGNSEWMVTTSCSAGPAFEGGGIKCGMVATEGAIQDFSTDNPDKEPEIKVVGNVKPKGICGSGLISIIADFLLSGIIDRNGKFDVRRSSQRIRVRADGPEYVIARASETQTGKDIVITEIDIDNLVRAKAAMYAGCLTLSRCVNITPSDFEQVIIAGNFGNSLNIEKAITIGLLPDISRDRFVFVGNGSLSGARLVNYSVEMLEEAQQSARMMTNIELSDNLDFNSNYTAALFLPHTSDDLFPSVLKKIKQRAKPLHSVDA